MEVYSVEPVIAERQYTLTGDDGLATPVLVRLGAPRESPDGLDYICPFEITGLARTRIKWAFGVDALQALELALKMLGADLHAHRADYGPGFFLDEMGDDLGFSED